MSSIRRRRYRRREAPNPFGDLGPGDPGYRLRPGASSLDPMEAYQEMGRVIGLTLKSLASGRSSGMVIPGFAILFAGLAWVMPRLVHTPAIAIPVDGRWVLGATLLAFVIVLLAFSWNHFRGRQTNDAV